MNVDDESVRRLAVAAGYDIAFTRVRMTVELEEPTAANFPAGVELRPAGPADHRAVFDGNAEHVVSGLDDTPWVGVADDWRRRGLASALLRTNHAALWRRGVRRTGLWTVAENRTGSVALYERAGYRVTVRQPRYRKAV